MNTNPAYDPPRVDVPVIRKKRIDPRRIMFTLSGVGAILLVIGFLILLPTFQHRIASTSATDFSAIPVRVHLDRPVLELTDLKGIQHLLADYQGKVILVNLWATWCPPCKAEMPELQDYYIQHQHSGFVVVAVDNGDTPSDVISFADQFQLTFPIWLDPSYQSGERAFKAINLPSSYVLDRTGEIILTWVGAINPTNLEKFVTPILGQ